MNKQQACDYAIANNFKFGVDVFLAFPTNENTNPDAKPQLIDCKDYNSVGCEYWDKITHDEFERHVKVSEFCEGYKR